MGPDAGSTTTDGEGSPESQPSGDGTGTPGTGDEMVSAPSLPSRRAAFIRSGVLLLVLFVVFGLILPQYIDYAEVKDALVALTPPQVALMTVLGAIAWFVTGQIFTILIPGLTPLRGNAAYLILSGTGSSIPFGPWNLGIVWVVMRGWGVSLQDATSGVALYGIIYTLGRFALPLIAIVVLALTQGTGSIGTATLIISIVSIAIFFIAVGVMLVVVNSEQAADRLGILLGRMVAWILARLGRKERPDVLGSIHKFQQDLGQVVHRRGLAALTMTIVAQLPWCLAFVVALRLTGVPADVLGPGDVVAVYALVGVITIIPIAPGGAGLPEILYIAGLSSIAGAQWESAITAGVFLFRLYAWFLPIPIAWILLKVVRRGQPMLPTAQELRAFTAGGL
jgi:putative heme transporter